MNMNSEPTWKKKFRFRISNQLTVDEVQNKMWVREVGDGFTVPNNSLECTLSLRNHQPNRVEYSWVQSDSIESGGVHTDRVESNSVRIYLVFLIYEKSPENIVENFRVS
jgi:transcriptional regulator